MTDERRNLDGLDPILLNRPDFIDRGREAGKWPENFFVKDHAAAIIHNEFAMPSITAYDPEAQKLVDGLLLKASTKPRTGASIATAAAVTAFSALPVPSAAEDFAGYNLKSPLPHKTNVLPAMPVNGMLVNFVQPKESPVEKGGDYAFKPPISKAAEIAAKIRSGQKNTGEDIQLTQQTSLMTTAPESVAAAESLHARVIVVEELPLEVVVDESFGTPRVGNSEDPAYAFAELLTAVRKLDFSHISLVLGEDDARILCDLGSVINSEKACLLSPASETVQALPAIRAKLAEPVILVALGKGNSEILGDFLAMFETAPVVKEDPRPALRGNFSVGQEFRLKVTELATGRF